MSADNDWEILDEVLTRMFLRTYGADMEILDEALARSVFNKRAKALVRKLAVERTVPPLHANIANLPPRWSSNVINAGWCVRDHLSDTA